MSLRNELVMIGGSYRIDGPQTDIYEPWQAKIDREREQSELKMRAFQNSKNWGIGKIIMEKYPDLTDEEFAELKAYCYKGQKQGQKLSDLLP